MNILKKIKYFLFYKVHNYGMCPDCIEKNKSQITFCTHSGNWYKFDKLKSATILSVTLVIFLLAIYKSL